MNELKKYFFAVFLASSLAAGVANAQSLDVQERLGLEEAALLTELANPDQIGWRIIEGKLVKIWSHSGSASVDLMLKRGEDALEDEDLEAAIDYFGAVIDHAPEFAEGWHSRATALYLAGYVGPALKDIKTALTLNPNHFGALVGLGVILGDLGETELALEAYERAQKINPHQENIQTGINALKKLAGRATL